ncbi:OmcA/MtrC family decaheme c-type cytochrome [Shewanella insulae]|uniref:OmcA/MtrC family decaheme c-type cytochrome n=1 Tax=Shewanella insulae TaxID=2681496 RepID=UPI001EFC7A9E|nr:OmcA/MtrC family decaheme c-type cytochrome [Shewanella insulae]MCG9713674.1 OmcA/MtrC family decaheme c-type cytochrome [Shewanella insulae]
MMKKFNVNAATKAVLGAGLLSLALSGCGSDGKDGEDGKDGVIGVNIDTTPTLQATFTNATIDAGKVTVDFKLQDTNGVAVLGLTKDHDLRFGVAQLTHVVETKADGETADRGFQWQAYINSEKAPNPDWVPEGDTDINPSNQFQADVEQAAKCDDCLVDNEDGSYTYTFQTNIANVTSPVTVTYDADATQRITLELKQPSVTANANYDFQPSSGATDGIQTRNVVSIETCYTCHQPESLALHGGRRINLENCASCHTATSGDPESGNSVDFTYMIHAIHRGEERHTYDADGNQVPAPYKVIGYKGGFHDYGKVMFPQKPAADCSSCHVEGSNAPANADLYKADLSNTACIACHSEKPSSHHSSTDCMACHNSTEPYGGTGSAFKRHGDVLKAYQDAEAMSVKFSNIGVDANGKFVFDVQVLGADGAALDGELLDQESRVVVAWDIDKDFPAYSDASYSNRRIKLKEGVYNAETKTYTITGSDFDLPADANGKTFELWSALKVCFNNGGYGVAEIKPTACATEGVRKVEAKQEAMHFVWKDGAIDDNATPAERRDIIDPSKCQGCHNQQIFHYDNGVNCQTCHTSDKSTKESVRGSGEYDKATSFAYKAHHAAGHDMNAKWGSGLKSETVMKTDCLTCHTAEDTRNKIDNGITLGRSPNRVWNYPNLETKEKAGIWVSSDAGACMSCHQAHLSDAAKSHIETNGGIIDGVDADDVRTRAAETCQTCHTPEKVMELHGY